MELKPATSTSASAKNLEDDEMFTEFYDFPKAWCFTIHNPTSSEIKVLKRVKVFDSSKRLTAIIRLTSKCPKIKNT